jgi:hypothetical protein
VEQVATSMVNVPTNKRVFVEGEVVGSARILKIRQEKTSYGDPIADVKCIVCGHERPMTHQQLRRHDSGHAKSCSICRNRRNADAAKKPIKIRGCRVCDDCPALRPWGGVCRGCGEKHEMPKVAR